MQTVEQTPIDPLPSGEEEDLQLLLNWAPDPAETIRLRVAFVGTIAFHLLLIAGLGVMPSQTSKPVQFRERQLLVTRIFDPPPVELTQKAPNKGKISKEIAVQSPAAAVPVPNPAPGASRKFTPPPAPKPAKPNAAMPSMVEPPKIELAQNTPQLDLPQIPQQTQPPPRPPSETKPKLAFENPPPAPTGPASAARLPGATINDAIRDLSRGGNRGLSGSDIELGNGAGMNMPPSPGRPRMDYDMKSDPQGVDFKPYILQVLAIVRRNWFAVYPESAKLGTRGQVRLEFAVAKDGRVTKVAYSTQSGTQALDHAAIAAISASNPLPALPADYHGERIVLTFTFSYNLGR